MSTVRCAACRAENPAHNKFCGECGGRLPVASVACRHPNPVGQKFCGECGAALTVAVHAAPVAAEATAVGMPEHETATPVAASAAPVRPGSALRDAAPAAYTPKHLAEKILRSRAAVEGERKLVTVMFSDVSGFTAMSERLDPEEVHAIMDRAFQVIIEAVHRYEGTINQFLGDGVMALFGAPIAHEDHPHRAIRAALDIQDGLTPLKREVRQAHGVKFRVRMGINTGLVFVGAIGKDLRMDYTAVGDTTNLAARLLGHAGPGQIVVSAQTKRFTDGFFRFEDMGEFQVKGKAEPVRAYEVKSEIRGRTRLEVSKERGLTPLVGRESELSTLADAYARADEGRGAVVLVSGEPGVGKSRLLYEFLQSLEGRPVLELEANCLPYTRSVPYYPILELMRRYLGLSETVRPEQIRTRVADQLQSLGLPGEEPAILLGHFLGVPAPEEFLIRFAGAQLKERTFNVLREMLFQASAAEPLVLVVENVHWADTSSEEFLGYLMEGLPGRRILLLMSARPGLTGAWLVLPLMEAIALGGLGPGEVHAMLRTLLGAEAVSASLLQLLVDKGEGNPLYVEEILQQLRETAGLVIEHGEVRLSAADVKVPATIQDIIAARIDRLADPVKHTLQVAAVVGRQFAVSLLSCVLETDGELARYLSDLQAGDFIFPAAREPELVYSFKHALTQEVAYASLLERKRRVYHAEVGVGLEELYTGRLDEVVELLAHHFGRSVEGEKAVDYSILAAEKAQRRWANTEALAYFDAALKRLEPMADTAPNRVRRIDAVVKQAEIKFALGRHAEQVQALEAIRNLVEAVADPPRRAAWHYWAGFLNSLTGARPEVSIADCREASRIADEAGLDEIRAFAECCLTHVYVVSGDLRDALTAGERALAVFEARGNVWWACRTLWGLSMAANASGLWSRSLEYCRRALEYGREVNDLRLKVVGSWRTGSTHIQRGEPEAGLRCLEEALALSPIPFDAAMVKAMQGYGFVKAGDLATGTRYLEETLAWFDQSHLPYTRSVMASLLADAYLRQGDRSRARGVVEQILATSREDGYRHLEGIAERLLAECLGADDPAAAAEHVEAAINLLEQIGAQNEMAKALVEKADLRRRAGDRTAAREFLQRALALFERLGTLDGPPRARAMLATLAVDDSRPCLFIVSRSERDLYVHLTREFSGHQRVQVVVDRREGERRRPGAANEPERRRAGRRSRPEVDDRIRSAGYALVFQGPGI